MMTIHKMFAIIFPSFQFHALFYFINLILLLQTTCVPQNFYVEVVIPNVTMFGNRVFKEITEVKWGCKGAAPVQQNWYSEKKKERH